MATPPAGGSSSPPVPPPTTPAAPTTTTAPLTAPISGMSAAEVIAFNQNFSSLSATIENIRKSIETVGAARTIDSQKQFMQLRNQFVDSLSELEEGYAALGQVSTKFNDDALTSFRKVIDDSNQLVETFKTSFSGVLGEPEFKKLQERTEKYVKEFTNYSREQHEDASRDINTFIDNLFEKQNAARRAQLEQYVENIGVIQDNIINIKNRVFSNYGIDTNVEDISNVIEYLKNAKKDYEELTKQTGVNIRILSAEDAERLRIAKETIKARLGLEEVNSDSLSLVDQTVATMQRLNAQLNTENNSLSEQTRLRVELTALLTQEKNALISNVQSKIQSIATNKELAASEQKLSDLFELNIEQMKKLTKESNSMASSFFSLFQTKNSAISSFALSAITNMDNLLKSTDKASLGFNSIFKGIGAAGGAFKDGFLKYFEDPKNTVGFFFDYLNQATVQTALNLDSTYASLNKTTGGLRSVIQDRVGTGFGALNRAGVRNLAATGEEFITKQGELVGSITMFNKLSRDQQEIITGTAIRLDRLGIATTQVSDMVNSFSGVLGNTVETAVELTEKIAAFGIQAGISASKSLEGFTTVKNQLINFSTSADEIYKKLLDIQIASGLSVKSVVDIGAKFDNIEAAQKALSALQYAASRSIGTNLALPSFQDLVRLDPAERILAINKAARDAGLSLANMGRGMDQFVASAFGISKLELGAILEKDMSDTTQNFGDFQKTLNDAAEGSKTSIEQIKTAFNSFTPAANLILMPLSAIANLFTLLNSATGGGFGIAAALGLLAVGIRKIYLAFQTARTAVSNMSLSLAQLGEAFTFASIGGMEFDALVTRLAGDNHVLEESMRKAANAAGTEASVFQRNTAALRAYSQATSEAALKTQNLTASQQKVGFLGGFGGTIGMMAAGIGISYLINKMVGDKPVTGTDIVYKNGKMINVNPESNVGGYIVPKNGNITTFTHDDNFFFARPNDAIDRKTNLFNNASKVNNRNTNVESSTSIASVISNMLPIFNNVVETYSSFQAMFDSTLEEVTSYLNSSFGDIITGDLLSTTKDTVKTVDRFSDVMRSNNEQLKTKIAEKETVKFEKETKNYEKLERSYKEMNDKMIATFTTTTGKFPENVTLHVDRLEPVLGDNFVSSLTKKVAGKFISSTGV